MKSFPHTITVLNKVETDDGVIYLPTVIEGVLYVASRSVSHSTTGVDNKDDIKCTIPFSAKVSKQFIGNIAYNKLSLDERLNYWTLSQGDIIVKDIISESQISLKTVNNNYEEKMVISYVDKFDFGGLRHWQIGGA